MKKIKIVLLSVVAAMSAFMAEADDYVVIGHEGKVFDSPKTKSYTTTNQEGEDVVVKEGMVFKKKESRQGWDLIEYTPGLNGFILQSLEAEANSLKTPAAGSYTVANNPEAKVTVAKEGTNWIATSGAKKYSGQLHDGAVIFYDADGNIALSLVVLNGTPVVFDYDNTLTRFF